MTRNSKLCHEYQWHLAGNENGSLGVIGIWNVNNISKNGEKELFFNLQDTESVKFIKKGNLATYPIHVSRQEHGKNCYPGVGWHLGWRLYNFELWSLKFLEINSLNEIFMYIILNMLPKKLYRRLKNNINVLTSF